MFKYRNENAFSKALVAAMKGKNIFVQRIESGGTGRGIPDIYAIIGNNAIWIELKRVHHRMQRYEEIPWRPGQQSWLTDVYNRGQAAITLCCFDDCVLKILHDRVYTRNVVDTSDCEAFFTLKDILK